MQMIKRVCLLLLPLCVSWMATVVYASEQQLKAFLSSTRTMAADFEQRITDESGNVLDISRGRLYLQRPGKFRWDYVANTVANSDSQGQQIIADGEQIYVYDPDLEQVTIRDLKDALGQVPSLLLVHGSSDLDEYFAIKTLEAAAESGISWVELAPKQDDSGYDSIRLGFAQDKLVSFTLLDGLGNRTNVYLSNARVNTKLAKDKFTFSAPEGVDVLRE